MTVKIPSLPSKIPLVDGIVGPSPEFNLAQKSIVGSVSA